VESRTGKPHAIKKSGVPEVNLDHSPFAVDHFAMRGHDPDEIQVAPRIATLEW
jgi:hypothetical protein